MFWSGTRGKAGLLLSGVITQLVAGCVLPTFVVAQAPSATQSTPGKSEGPASEAYVVRFRATRWSEDGTDIRDRVLGRGTGGPGPLHIIYSDGTDVEIPNERGAYREGEEILAQDAFVNIQLADDRQHIGWQADYMMCAQSYPCSMQLVIYHSGGKAMSIGPSYGVIWDWKFLKGGQQVVVQSGFTHGDETGAYALYETETGRELATFGVGDFPNWVQEFLRR